MKTDNKVSKTESLIAHTHFQGDKNMKWDLSAREMNYIKTRQRYSHDDKAEPDDLMNIMYDCYKLGFAKGLLKAQEERN